MPRQEALISMASQEKASKQDRKWMIMRTLRTVPLLHSVSPLEPCPYETLRPHPSFPSEKRTHSSF